MPKEGLQPNNPAFYTPPEQYLLLREYLKLGHIPLGCARLFFALAIDSGNEMTLWVRLCQHKMKQKNGARFLAPLCLYTLC